MNHPNRQDFIAAFGDGLGFTGPVVEFSKEPETYRLSELLGGKSWTEVPYDHLRMLQTSLAWLTPQAFRHFFPAYVFEAMTDLNGEDLDYTVLNFIAGRETALLDVGFSKDQLLLLLDALDYIRVHSKETFEGLGESLENHQRLAAQMSE